MWLSLQILSNLELFFHCFVINSLADQTEDVFVNASRYIFYYGNVSYHWTTDPKLPNIHESKVYVNAIHYS